MSWVVTAIAGGLALTGGGTAMEMIGQQQSADAMAGARDQYRQQQNQLQQQASGIFKQSMQQNSLPQTQATLQQGAQQRLQLGSALKQASMPTGQALPANAPTYASQSGPVARAGRVAATGGNLLQQQQAQNQARVQALGDLATSQNVNRLWASDRLSPIISSSRQKLAILPTELEAASHTGDDLSQWGQLVSALGSLAMMGGGIAAAGAAPAAGGGSAAGDYVVNPAVTGLA